MSGVEPCPVCNGEGRVYRMTPAYEAMAGAVGGGSFGWTGQTHEWRNCHVCAGLGVFTGSALAEAVAAERERIRAAVEALPSRCHSHSGLRCENDWFDGDCSLVDGHAVLRIVEGEDA